MKRFSTILGYLKDKKGNIALYVLFNLLSIVFSIVSLAMLAPFLQLLFGKDPPVLVRPPLAFSASSILENIKYIISTLINEHDKVYALGFICVIIVIAILFKNLFLYLSYRVLAPMRNYVMTRLRSDLYAKILELPIGYFTEQRKGDIISRMSNDANEVEWSVMATLEALIREPMTILIYLVMLVMLSPTLSVFLFVLLPVTGFLIGRISRSLKKQSATAQKEAGTLMSILDETLGGLRVIKAFNAEKLLRGKFNNSNTFLNNIRNKMMFRRDLASPMSEFLGVLVLVCVLWFGGRLALSETTLLGPPLSADAFITYIILFTQIITRPKVCRQHFTTHNAAAPPFSA